MSTLNADLWEIESRIHEARGDLVDDGYPTSKFVAHIAADLWERAVQQLSPTVVVSGRLFGFEVVLDRTLSDDQIRLRYEVSA